MTDKPDTMLGKIETFCVSQIAKCPGQDKIRHFALHHASGAKGEKVGRLIDTYPPSDENPAETVARDIGFRAQDDVNNFKARQIYLILAFRESDPSSPCSSYPFSCAPVAEEGDIWSVQEDATTTGLLGQLMKHMEADRRTQVQEREVVLKAMGKLENVVDKQADIITSILQDQKDMVEERTQLALTKIAVESEAAQRAAEEEGQQNTIKGVLVENLRTILPQAGPAVLQNVIDMMQRMMQSKTPTVKQLAQALTDEQKVEMLREMGFGNMIPAGAIVVETPAPRTQPPEPKGTTHHE